MSDDPKNLQRLAIAALKKSRAFERNIEARQLDLEAVVASMQRNRRRANRYRNLAKKYTDLIRKAEKKAAQSCDRHLELEM